MTHRVAYDSSPIDATITSKAFWLQVLDRSFKTALQSVAVFFGVGVGVTAIDWKQAAVSVGVTVAITVVLSLTSAKLYEVESFSVDLMQRAARTFLATFVGAAIAIDDLRNIDWGNAASLAASATILSIITNMTVRNVGVTNTASVFPGAELIPTAKLAIDQRIAEGTAQWNQGVEQFHGQVRTAMDSLQRPPQ